MKLGSEAKTMSDARAVLVFARTVGIFKVSDVFGLRSLDPDLSREWYQRDRLIRRLARAGALQELQEGVGKPRFYKLGNSTLVEMALASDRELDRVIWALGPLGVPSVSLSPPSTPSAPLKSSTTLENQEEDAPMEDTTASMFISETDRKNGSAMGLVRNREWTEHEYMLAQENQFLRELTKNSMEAGATLVKVVRNAVLYAAGLSKVMVADNGRGMNPDDQNKFIGNFAASGKKLGPNENFGVGAKVMTLPKSPLGVIIISKRVDSEWSMFRIGESEDGDFKVIDWEVEELREDGTVRVSRRKHTEPGEAYIKMFEELFPGAKSGTMVTLMGRTTEEDTYCAKDKAEVGTKGRDAEYQKYLNTRYLTLPEGVELTALSTGNDEQNRRIEGGRALFDKYSLPANRGCVNQTIPFPGGPTVNFKVHFWVMELAGYQSRDSLMVALPTTYGPSAGLIATLHDGELYDLDFNSNPAGKQKLSDFGFMWGDVRRRMILVIEPQLTDGDTTLFAPNRQRSELLFVGGKNRPNMAFPFAEVAAAFMNVMPASLRALLESVAPKTDAKKEADYFESLKEATARMKYVPVTKQVTEEVITTTTELRKVTLRKKGVHHPPGNKGGDPWKERTDNDQEDDGVDSLREVEVTHKVTRLRSKKVVEPPKPPNFRWVKEDDIQAEIPKGTAARYDSASNWLWMNEDYFRIVAETSYWTDEYMKNLGGLSRHLVERDVREALQTRYVRHLAAVITDARSCFPEAPGFTSADLEAMLSPKMLSFAVGGLTWVNIKTLLGPMFGKRSNAFKAIPTEPIPDDEHDHIPPAVEEAS